MFVTLIYKKKEKLTTNKYGKILISDIYITNVLFYTITKMYTSMKYLVISNLL